jgi:hypothetical protein
MTQTTSGVDTATVLQDLVNQFSDPMSFLRELIQNSIDAGSGEIDVRVEFAPDKGGGEKGLMTVFVDDFGEGMSRDIIETKLTRLFSSGKDDDYTKIGRFGIGFVSIFAIEPQAVCVDTGRGGEYWRVLFKQDRTFDLIRMDQPVEGTQIRIFKQMTRAQVDTFRQRTREVITYWCKHVHVPIYVEGEQVNQDFDLASDCKIVFEEEGTRAVMGFVDQPRAPYGFYNRGLTLKEGEESEWPYISLKIDSRYLEHTLTRDQVLKDRHYHKAHRLLETMATEQLPEQLLTQLEQAARASRVMTDAQASLMWHLVRWIRSKGDFTQNRRDRREIIPTLYAQPVSVHECARRHKKGEFLVTPSRTHITDALQHNHLIVVAQPSTVNDPIWALLSQCLESRPMLVDDVWVLPRSSMQDRAPGADALKQKLASLLAALGGACEQIVLMDFDYLESGRSPIRGMLGLCANSVEQPLPRKDLAPMRRESLVKTRVLALNAADERIAKLLALATREPEWAAFTLCKMLLLEEGLRAEDDAALVTRAILERKERHRLAGGRS